MSKYDEFILRPNDSKVRFEYIKELNDEKRKLLQEHPELNDYQKQIDEGIAKLGKDATHLEKAELLVSYAKNSHARIPVEIAKLKDLVQELKIDILIAELNNDKT